MVKPKLSYFDFPGGRGEDCRIALFMAGVDFEDDRIPPSQWSERKAGTPFGSIPVLELEGQGKLAQSNAILVYLGRSYGMHPSDPWEAAQHEAIMSAVEDLRGAVAATFRFTEEAERKQARETLANTTIKSWGANVEALLGEGPFVAGDTLNVVDLKLYVLMKWFVSGTIDHVPADVLAGYPKLMRLYDAVHHHEQVVAWYAR